MIDQANRRVTFFRVLFGKESKGYVCLAIMDPASKKFNERFFYWPDEEEALHSNVEKFAETHNVYFCPQLLKDRKRTKDNVKACPNIWADLDTCEPEHLMVEPTIVIESSPGRFQSYWVMDSVLNPDDAEHLARRIAYYHANQGADRSGWDLTQLLRVPLTANLKPDYFDVKTKVIAIRRGSYRLDDFRRYPEVKATEKERIPFPEDLPDTTGNSIMEKYDRLLPPQMVTFYQEEPEDDWSKPLWSLQMMCFEAGMSRQETFIVARDSACNKYRRDGRPENYLWKEVCRAYVKFEENLDVVAPEEWQLPDLLEKEERARIEGRKTFVERYIDWARSLGDAAPQYHQAGAFVILSTLLAGSVRLPTSFGIVKPNLWFMILADTTLTRKTTAMDIAMDLITDMDSDMVLATDGSIEGLLGSLSTRPGKPSIFLRDEFSGLLEMITKKDYYAGMAELLTKLYDGKMQKRVLRKEVIEVKDPVLVLFAGGIFTRVAGLLTREHVSSGFMPRFVFITAESDLDRVKPLGPPTNATQEGRTAIMEELQDLSAFYSTSDTIQNVDGKLTWTGVQSHEAQLTPEAWLRYNRLEADMMRAGLASDHPDIMTPTYDRLCKSILKAAVLMAATERRQQRGANIEVNIEDLLVAMRYGEEWRTHTNQVITNVGKTTNERELDTICRAISTTPGVQRSKLMQTYHLTARNADNIFLTLEQRGLIIRKKAGRGEFYYPLGYVGAMPQLKTVRPDQAELARPTSLNFGG